MRCAVMSARHLALYLLAAFSILHSREKLTCFQETKKACGACRPESRIAVVSHCGFIFLTLSAFGHECAHSVQEEMHRGFDNCEMRSMIITDAAGGGRFNSSWFPGGRECLRK